MTGLEKVAIISRVLSLRSEAVLAHPDREMGESAARRIKDLFAQRETGKPLAYITGEKEFFSHPFAVDGNVLIPRPDTEVLVEEALSILGGRPLMRSVVDMGTGSGIIGNTVARKSGRSVLCVDVSTPALSVAQKNGRDPAVSGRLTFLCSDLFYAVKKGARFDMVLANLPYVPEGEWEDLMKDVKEFEPALALLGGADGLDVYRSFVRALPDHMEEGGYVLCEIGSARQADMLGELLASVGCMVTKKKDLAGKERVVIGKWINS